ncbi:MAG: hypothetical protein Q7T83_10750 [Thermodesulfovibrionales bacterium]|nr:hypothetical protein [Thermodesulfovibrionales bacterium]MDP3110823.1 hypothetical protein [Thermodesulfovibrionales bacterium]
MAEDPVDEFAKILLQHSQELADVRSESSLIPLDKYAHLRDFAQMLVFDCYSTTTLEKESGEINDKQFYETFLEYLYFFIHLTDRFAFSSLGDPGRHKLMDELGLFAVTLSVQSLFPSLSDEEQDARFQECMGCLNIAVNEYHHYQQLFPSGDEGTKDTLFWEFSKKIAQMRGLGHNPAVIIGHEYILVAGLENLDIKSFLEKMK